MLKILFFENISINIVVRNLAIKFIVRNVVITPQGGHGFAMWGRDGKMCDVKSHVRSHMKSHIKCHAMKVNMSGKVEMMGVM